MMAASPAIVASYGGGLSGSAPSPRSTFLSSGPVISNLVIFAGNLNSNSCQVTANQPVAIDGVEGQSRRKAPGLVLEALSCLPTVRWNAYPGPAAGNPRVNSDSALASTRPRGRGAGFAMRGG